MSTQDKVRMSVHSRPQLNRRELTSVGVVVYHGIHTSKIRWQVRTTRVLSLFGTPQSDTLSRALMNTNGEPGVSIILELTLLYWHLEATTLP